jgi:hypothetical protein
MKDTMVAFDFDMMELERRVQFLRELLALDETVKDEIPLLIQIFGGMKND